MNKTKKLLMKASQKLELPADVTVGVPRIEIVGRSECSIEPHRGLSEYSTNKICISTATGPVAVLGKNIEIKRMNAARITICGNIAEIYLAEKENE